MSNNFELTKNCHGRSENDPISLDSKVPPQLPAHVQIPIASGFEETKSQPLPPIWQRWQPSQEQLESMSKSKTYGAPRVFDLFTLLAITLAFAVLFALLGLLAPGLDLTATELTVAIGGFVTLVGFSQMWLFGSNNPRVASLISGPVAFAIVVFPPLLRSSNTLYESIFGSLCFGLFLGPMFGYLAGAVVAGVFLVADKFRTTVMSSSSDKQEARFDDVQ